MICTILPWIVGGAVAGLMHYAGFNPGQGAGVALAVYGVILVGVSS